MEYSIFGEYRKDGLSVYIFHDVPQKGQCVCCGKEYKDRHKQKYFYSFLHRNVEVQWWACNECSRKRKAEVRSIVDEKAKPILDSIEYQLKKIFFGLIMGKYNYVKIKKGKLRSDFDFTFEDEGGAIIEVSQQGGKCIPCGKEGSKDNPLGALVLGSSLTDVIWDRCLDCSSLYRGEIPKEVQKKSKELSSKADAAILCATMYYFDGFHPPIPGFSLRQASQKSSPAVSDLQLEESV